MGRLWNLGEVFVGSKRLTQQLTGGAFYPFKVVAQSFVKNNYLADISMTFLKNIRRFSGIMP